MNTSNKLPFKSAKKVSFDESMLHVELEDGNTVSAPLSRFPRLLGGSVEQRALWRCVGAGDGIHWPLLDEDISISGLMKQAGAAGIGPQRMNEISGVVGEIYARARKLSDLTGGRSFTLDGVFVSTTGRVVAEYIYGLVKETQQNDARTADGRSVQIMLIGNRGKSFSVRWTEANRASHAEVMLCLQVGEDGFSEIYNGEFPTALLTGRAVGKNGQARVPLSVLRDSNPALLPKRYSFASINQFFLSSLSNAA